MLSVAANNTLQDVHTIDLHLSVLSQILHLQIFKQIVAAGYPVFLFPTLLDHVMSFLVVVRSYSIYQLERFTRSNDVLTLDNEYVLVCTDWLVSSEVYISLFVRIGLFRPNKLLTPVYKCT